MTSSQLLSKFNVASNNHLSLSTHLLPSRQWSFGNRGNSRARPISFILDKTFVLYPEYVHTSHMSRFSARNWRQNLELSAVMSARRRSLREEEDGVVIVEFWSLQFVNWAQNQILQIFEVEFVDGLEVQGGIGADWDYRVHMGGFGGSHSGNLYAFRIWDRSFDFV